MKFSEYFPAYYSILEHRATSNRTPKGAGSSVSIVTR
jgi:hypothetical protein